MSPDVMTDCSFLTKAEIIRRVKSVFSFTPAGIVTALGLKRPVFAAGTNYGHFGKEELPREQLDADKVEKLRLG